MERQQASQQSGSVGAVAEAPKKKVRGRPWVKGQSGNPSGLPKEELGEAPVVTDEQFSEGDEPQMLVDMRRVAGTRRRSDETVMQKKLRKLFDSDFGRFCDRMAMLEKAHSGQKVVTESAAPEKVEAVGEGTARVLSLIEELRGEWTEEAERKGWK